MAEDDEMKESEGLEDALECKRRPLQCAHGVKGGVKI